MKPSLLELLTLHVAKRYLVFDMKRKVYITLGAVLLLIIVGCTLFIFIPNKTDKQLSAVCRVEGKAYYLLKVNNKDTLYLSLRDDSLQTACLQANDTDEVHYQSGTFVSNEGDLITSDALMGNYPDSLNAQQLRTRLIRLDTLLSQKLINDRGEKEELDDYARTHTVVDDGYNEVMAYRVKVTERAEQTDSTLKLIKAALKSKQKETAQLVLDVNVGNAHMTTQKAQLRAHKSGLLLLQLNSKTLPKDCQRFSVYRWGVRHNRSRLLAYNDLGSACQLPDPTLTDSESELFTAAEGGVWVNRSGHISGIQYKKGRISSYDVARLMRSVHCWPMWWWQNLQGWIKRLSAKSTTTKRATAPTSLQCKRFTIADSLIYVGTVNPNKNINNHPMRQGYGQLIYPNGKQYVGYWQKDSLHSGKCLSSRGIYEGSFDKEGEFDGQGKLYAANGEYYEGEWNAGKRSGHGFSSQYHRMVRCGSWRNGRFQGERMVYTADRVYGIDISRHQHEKGSGRRGKKYGIDWSNLRISSLGNGRRVQGTVNYPVSFAYIKATEGRSVFNKYYPNDLRQARKHGIAVGSYHFFTTTSSGAQQANYFLRMAWIGQSDLPPVLDLEPTEAQIRKIGGDATLFRQVLVWLHRVEQKHGKRPILYVGQLFVNNHLKHAPAELRHYDVWIARYGEFKPYVKLLHWQLTPYGRVRGIHGEVDINVFNGTKESFEKYRRR